MHYFKIAKGLLALKKSQEKCLPVQARMHILRQMFRTVKQLNAPQPPVYICDQYQWYPRPWPAPEVRTSGAQHPQLGIRRLAWLLHY